MTVGDLMSRMSYAEFVEQMAYDNLLAKEAEKAQRLAKKGMSTSRPRRR